MPMLRVVLLPLILASALWIADARAKPQPDGCPEDKPMVVNAFANFRNVADEGLDGHVWALDQGTQYIQIWQTGENAYCVKRRDVGTFATYAGVSPAGTGTISAGVTGSFQGTTYLRINGIFKANVPTSGYIGDFDAQCQQDGSCSGQRLRTSALYFSRTNKVDFGWFLFAADGGACGKWIQTASGSVGDIVC